MTICKKILAGISLFSLLILPTSAAMADNASISAEIDALKTRIAQLEKATMNNASKTPPSVADGLIISGGSTITLQSSIDANGTPRRGEDVTDATYSIDIAISKPVGDNGEIFLTLEGGNGEGVDGEVQTFSGVNGDALADGDTIRIAEAGYSHSFADDKFSLTFGVLDSTGLLDANNFANDECSQFLSPIFVNNPAIEFTQDYTVGATITAALCESVTLDAGMYENDGDAEDVTDNSFIFAQTTVKTNIGDQEGNYRLFLWANQSNHTKFNDATKTYEDNTGIGISCDQKINDNIGLFLRYAQQDKDVSTLESSWSFGSSISGDIWGCSADELGIAVGQNMPSEEYKNLGNPGENETLMEIYYKWQVNDNVAISPDVQVIWDPNGIDNPNVGRDDTIIVAGLRAQLDF